MAIAASKKLYGLFFVIRRIYMKSLVIVVIHDASGSALGQPGLNPLNPI
jgi:hypothetical protein